MNVGVRSPGAAHDTTWDRTAWRLERPRLVAAAGLAAYAVALLVLGSGTVRWFAALLAVDLVVMSLPWRVPRDTRSVPSLWLETLAYQVAPVGALVVAVADDRRWLTELGAPGWYVAGALLGAGLVLLSGMRLRLLLGGELAFLAGPDRWGHAVALASSALVAAVCEEVLFRGVGLDARDTGDVAAYVLAAVAAVGFVARHHLPPAASARTTAQGVLTQFAGAAGLLVLVLASGSIYPAMVAHLVNNAPSAVLAVQRAQLGGEG